MNAKIGVKLLVFTLIQFNSIQFNCLILSTIWPARCVHHNSLKVGNTLGDKLQQHVAVTDHSKWTDRATSCSNTVRRHVATTNRFVCTGEFWENLCLRNGILSLQQVAKNQIRLNLCDLLRRQNSVAATNIFSKFSSTHEAICRCDVSPHRVAATCRLVCTDLKLLYSKGVVKDLLSALRKDRY